MLLGIVCFVGFSAIGDAQTSSTANSETRAIAGEFAALRMFLAISPKSRFDAAVNAGDFRVLMVEGYLLEVPPHAQVPCYGVQVIPQTTDSPLSEEHAELIRRARVYAAEYNLLLQQKPLYKQRLLQHILENLRAGTPPASDCTSRKFVAEIRPLNRGCSIRRLML